MVSRTTFTRSRYGKAVWCPGFSRQARSTPAQTWIPNGTIRPPLLYRKRTRPQQAAFTLVEIMVAFGLGLLVLAVVLAFVFYSGRSFAVLTNYMDLDQRTQMALDKMSREIRQVNMLTAYSPTNLSFQDFDGGTLQYVYDANAQTLTRIKTGEATTTYLTGCDSLSFAIFQRTPKNDTFQPYSTTAVTKTKLVELTWNCSRKLLGTTASTEGIQSAKIVIRSK